MESKMTKRIVQIGLVLVPLLLVNVYTSVALAEPDAKYDKIKAKIASEQKVVYAKMLKVINGASCKTDAQCASMPVGNANCGGPVSYLTYSTMIGDEAVSELTELSEETKRWDIAMSKYELKSGDGSYGICRYNTPSDVACINDVCKAVANDVIR